MNHSLLREKHREFSDILKYNENSNETVGFAALLDKCYRCFENRVRTKRYTRGEVIMSEFDKSEGIFLVRSGLVKLTKQDENGKEFIVSIKNKGEIFAESCLFNSKESTYSYTATMIQKGEVVFLDSYYIENEIKACPHLSVTLIRLMSKQIDEFSDRLIEMAHSDIFSKIVKTIDTLSKKYGKEMNNIIYVDLPISIQDISMLVGASRESTSRAFSKLKKNHMIEMKQKRIIIRDWERFSALLEKEY